MYPYKQGSQSAKLLAESLEGKVLFKEGSKYVPRPHKKVINWGSSDCPWPDCLNPSGRIEIVTDKLSFFTYISEVVPEESRPRIPKWTADKNKAKEWSEKGIVVCRTVLTGHSGNGIVLAGRSKKDKFGDVVDAPLYVKYLPKEAEYRVHIFGDRVIDIQRKIKDPNREVADWRIRSHQNGFIYARHQLGSDKTYMEMSNEDVIKQATLAVKCVGLTFGAVDVILSDGKAYVLEINTAPGLEGKSVEIYSNAIKEYFKNE